MLVRRWYLLLLCLGYSLAWQAQASERIALVIGNSAYKSAPLVNPRNDANAMAALLEKAGFTVDKQLDTPLKNLQAAVDRFGQAIRDPKIKFGMFYYAGHGLQQDWRNYLVPVTANIRNGAEVPQQTVDVSKLLRYMEQAQGRSFLVILDACRDDPFAGSYKPSAAGLSQFDAPGGSLLAYATAPGNVAQDGDGENGLYTGFLLKEFAVPGARLEDAFKRVRLNVRLASRGAQIPWESTSLEEDVYIFPTKTRSLSEADRDQLLEKEIAQWLKVKNSSDPQVLADFIREFPSGNASELAQSRLNRLLAAAAERERQLALQRAQEEQRRRDQADLARQQAEAARQKAEREASARAEAVRLASAAAMAAQEVARRLAEAQAEAQRVALAAAAEMAARVAEQMARDRLMAQQKAEAEAKRLQAEQLAQAETKRQQQEAQARAEALRAEQARQESERMAAAKAEAERQEIAKLEAERLEAAKAEAERLEIARQAAVREAQAAAQQLAEMERLRAVQETQRLALINQTPAPTPVTPATANVIASLPATPYFQGFNEHRRDFSVGDEFNIKVIDVYSKATKPMVMKVSQVDADAERVVYNGGEYVSDLMGNITTNLRGLLSTPRQFYPAELVVGKKWKTRFKQTRANGTVYTFQYDVKVVGREKITVPAGTFDTFKIEARGYNMELGARIERNIWVAPGVNADIAHEILVRLRNGTIEQNDRQELVSFSQKIQGAANLASR